MKNHTIWALSLVIATTAPTGADDERATILEPAEVTEETVVDEGNDDRK